MVRARKNDDEEPPNVDKHEERMNDLDLGDLYPNCLCGRRARLCTSWTNANPGRRFWGCSNFRGDVNCGYFRWHDPPICERSKQIIPGLLRRIQELEMRMGESNDFEGNHQDVSSAAVMGRNHQSDPRRINLFRVLVSSIVILVVVLATISEKHVV
ncbi:hypothetical protein Q3G72_004815 [Acer saccharum]|nr:hypothetical protein Q3G72_024865 [Acer saccharum]KAK1581303.1 hypothetical protein Q3G72_004815 [Acer saccharum]